MCALNQENSFIIYKFFFDIFMMKTSQHLLAFVLLIGMINAHADAIKYRQLDGKVMITNQPSNDGSKVISIQQEDRITHEQQRAAQDDLERQRAYLNAREKQNLTSQPKYSALPASSGKDISVIHACLMKVTGTFGLLPAEQARRKVACYSGTSGLNDDCQRSVAATMTISTNSENFYKRQCPQ